MTSKPRSSLGPIPLIDGISITIAAERDRWISTFTRGEEVIAEERSKTPPWAGRYAAGRLTNVVCTAIPLDKKTVRAAIIKIFEAIEGSDDARALVSEPAARVIGETVAVRVEVSDPPTYVIDLEGGKSLAFTARDVAAHAPIALNTRWLTVHPREPLGASGPDFETVIDFWLSIAEEVEPAGSVSPWESVVERLQIRIAPLEAPQTPDGLIKGGIYQEPGGPLWISGRLVGDVLKDSGRNENDAGFSKFLQAAGLLVCPSQPKRLGKMLIRAWGFTPDFRPEDPKVSDFSDLTAEEVAP